MMHNRSSYFTNKKTIVQFVLSLFVFFIHFRVFSVFANSGHFLNNILDLLLTLTHVAVPLFFIISGALFYRNYTPALTIQKWKSRFFSLCIPYLIWNTIWLILALLGYYTPLGSYLGGVKTAFSWEAVFNGIFLHGFFEPFWFVLQLIVLTALCPIIYLLLKNKKIGIITIVVFFVLYCLGFRLNGILFENSGMVIFYLLGSWIGIHYFELFTIRRSKKQAVIGLFIYIACCVFIGAEHLFPQWIITLHIPLIVRLISCGSFWVAFDYFDMKKCPSYMSDSFLIYAMHSLVGATVAKLFCMVLPNGEVYTLLTALIAFPITIIIICTFGKLIGKYCPQIKRILVGR